MNDIIAMVTTTTIYHFSYSVRLWFQQEEGWREQGVEWPGKIIIIHVMPLFTLTQLAPSSILQDAWESQRFECAYFNQQK